MSTLRKRRVFVGSSTEGLPRARAICGALTDERTEPVLWTQEFPPGYVTIEGLERVLSDCSGAVFVATPDDETTIHGRVVKMPRANVMLEFGLLAGRLGRHNIAICRYAETEMPSDLKGLTVIEMEPSASTGVDAGSAGTPRNPEDALAAWSAELLSTAGGTERTSVVHGYTGAWDFELALEQWRGLALSGGSYVIGSGTAHLHVDVTGSSATGILKGALTIMLVVEPGSRMAAYSSELRFCHEIIRAGCVQEGGIHLTTRIFSLHNRINSGKLPKELGVPDDPPSPWPFEWSLSPNGEARTLEGTIEARNPGTSKGRIQFIKRV
ncbi:MAG TPA: nucleotide-binding protein [Vicinamibacterales bacterium]|nr:nucleotide-binding protein [Vicinamibacterales bacterium]